MRLIVCITTALFAIAVQAREFRAADIQPDDYPTVLAQARDRYLQVCLLRI